MELKRRLMLKCRYCESLDFKITGDEGKHNSSIICLKCGKEVADNNISFKMLPLKEEVLK